ncbi:GspH/FimT family pseudopilin [Hyphobacterium sp. CCMP332]|uniref:GspH/FimT family protein n=1 Tax=Hyphobacterium sp. CCMP332 TaxID=2749086 RepID=UPI00165072F5|nr:GspH/FimT family protein [Hyphobacterium sp. CCMP332]QNL19515.1 GspH/FimT family pseudopilin [Hyphobacterium sp. CCMP332]
MKTSSEISSSRRGFTLTELLVVLVVVGLAIALVGPMLFRNSPASELRHSVELIETAARMARTEARLSGRDTLLSLDLDARTLTVLPSERGFQLGRNIDLRATVADQELDGDIASVRFFPEGATTGGTFLLELDDTQRAIRISWITGATERLDPDDIE